MFKIDETEDIRVLAVQPKIADRKTGEQKIDRVSNLPVWSVSALKMSDDPLEKPELITVSVTSRTEPEVVPLATGFEGLEVGNYAIPGDGGGIQAAGLFFRASGLVELQA
ncbi:MAG: hypothetical protein ACTH34_05410 [Microbacterium gubbeenense]|uniref:hypothetical protein n=1 Tax=Microbacterium gubbeenense TaxID=159896 RepID=UPI0004054208|nr:hypothetical protein [Microbacterium gubbeenense]